MTYVQELANGLADWEPFRWYAVAALTVFVAQGVLIVGFLTQRAARRRAEAAAS